MGVEIPESAVAAPASPSGSILTLVGTAVVDDRAVSLAVVETDGRNQLYLREGDLVDNIRITRILRDRIIVDAGNGEESIKLGQGLAEGSAVLKNVTKSTPLEAYGGGIPANRNPNVVYLDRNSKNSLLGNIDSMLKEVRFDPVLIYGRPTGIRISSIEPGSVFSEIGIKSGEVIREVNGKAMTRAQDAIALLQSMQKGGDFDIKVKGRRTRRIHLVVK